ncbi:MAG: DUF192 domain-containing protein [Candidatus Scalinduaceae bacterium]
MMSSCFDIVRSNYFQIFFLVVLTPVLWGCSKHTNISNSSLYEIKINNEIIHVEVASTQSERMLGLMFREKLDKNHGMLFIYPQEEYLSFWMKNTRIPLSLAFINSNGKIIQIESMVPYSLTNHVSEDKVRYALEMEEDWFRKNEIRVGSKVSFTSEINKINVR